MLDTVAPDVNAGVGGPWLYNGGGGIVLTRGGAGYAIGAPQCPFVSVVGEALSGTGVNVGKVALGGKGAVPGASVGIDEMGD